MVRRPNSTLTAHSALQPSRLQSVPETWQRIPDPYPRIQILHSRIARKRDQWLTLQIEKSHAMQEYLHKRRFFEETTGAIMQSFQNGNGFVNPVSGSQAYQLRADKRGNVLSALARSICAKNIWEGRASAIDSHNKRKRRCSLSASWDVPPSFFSSAAAICTVSNTESHMVVCPNECTWAHDPLLLCVPSQPRSPFQQGCIGDSGQAALLRSYPQAAHIAETAEGYTNSGHPTPRTGSQDATYLRLEVQRAQQAVGTSLTFFDGSRKKFMDAVRASNTVVHDQLAGILESDEKALCQSIAKLRDLYDAMDSLDKQILKEDGAEAGATEEHLRNFLDSGEIIPIVRGPVDDDDESEPEMPTLLREYFDAIGELRLMRDRLEDELPYEHADQKLKRQRMVDQDEVVFESEEELEERCRQEADEVHSEIYNLIIRINKLYAEVEAAGLDPDPAHYRRRSLSGSVEDWLEAVATPVNVSSDPIEEPLPLLPSDGFDPVLGSVRVSPEQLKSLQPLADSTTTSNSDGSAPRLQRLDVDDGQQHMNSPDRSYSHARHTDLGAVATAQCHGSGLSLSMSECTERASVRSATHFDQDLREKDAELQWVLLRDPRRQGSPAYSTAATNTSGGSMDSLAAIIDGDVSSMQYGALSSGSTKATLCHGPRTGDGVLLRDEACGDDEDEQGHECYHDDITLFTFSCVAMLQPQKQDYFVRGVVFETSLAESLQAQPFPAQAIAWRPTTTLMVFKRNAKDCVACPILAGQPDEPYADSDMSIIYVQEEGTSSSGPCGDHHEHNMTLRVKTSLPGMGIGARMRMTLSATVPIPFDARVRHIGNLEQKSLFDLVQFLGKDEKSMYSMRLP
ncbi:hypothetical protein CERZMDRAFT_82348 [Cercospora zeae-maydis SCOH1-5]|uniref:Uncharacterized protein n=1 Tax=Cercospora zeae-maydis SCOH1-5 TaxID=717836 RepID=A0A6A6FQ40_9PEZI|nr:hypothetical protein CERZMDRAFT_82348 [Cercospora zeae-maydis SCOH1-5]